MNVGSAGNVPHPVRDSLCNFVVLQHVGSNHLHIDRRRQSKIQNLRDDVRGLQEEFGAGKLLRQNFTQVSHELCAGRMMLRV